MASVGLTVCLTQPAVKAEMLMKQKQRMVAGRQIMVVNPLLKTVEIELLGDVK
jgi:hypothetical protein